MNQTKQHGGKYEEVQPKIQQWFNASLVGAIAVVGHSFASKDVFVYFSASWCWWHSVKFGFACTGTRQQCPGVTHSIFHSELLDDSLQWTWHGTQTCLEANFEQTSGRFRAANIVHTTKVTSAFSLLSHREIFSWSRTFGNIQWSDIIWQQGDWEGQWAGPVYCEEWSQLLQCLDMQHPITITTAT